MDVGRGTTGQKTWRQRNQIKTVEEIVQLFSYFKKKIEPFMTLI